MQKETEKYGTLFIVFVRGVEPEVWRIRNWPEVIFIPFALYGHLNSSEIYSHC